MEYFILNKIKFVLSFLIAFLSFQTVISQTIGRPTSTASSFCANRTQSENNTIFEVNSDYDPGIYTNNNIFSLILSDPDGMFPDNPVVLDTLPTDNTNFDLVFSFDVSEFIESFEGSDDYELRVIASEGGQSQDLPRAIYYVNADASLGLELEATPDVLCLSDVNTIRAFPNDFEEYEWYRNELDQPAAPGTLIPGETSNTLEVTQPGLYFFRINIGACNFGTIGNLARSQFSEVMENNGMEVDIEALTPTTVCSDEPVMLQSSISDANFVYRWFKDDVALSDVNTDNLFVSGSREPILTVSGIESEGSYTLSTAVSEIGDCTVQSEPINITLLNPRIDITSEAIVILLPPGEPKTLTAEVIRGTNPEITWFIDGTIIPDSNTTDLDVTQPGNYTVALTADSPCDEDNTVLAEGSVDVIPAENLTITINYSDPTAYQDCELDQVTLEVTQVTANVNGVSTVLEGTALDGLQVDWLQDGESTGETDRSLLINSASGNGTYTASIQVGEENPSVSNPVSVILALDSFQISRNPETLALGETVDLSLGLEDETGYTFQWIRNNTEPVDNSNSSTITVDEPGLYSVDITFSVCGTERVGPISLNSGSAVIPNVITPNGDGINDDWILTSELTLNDAVEVNIYSTNGELDYSTTGYDGEWPNESASNAVGTIYYYVINMNNNLVEQGSITIIR